MLLLGPLDVVRRRAAPRTLGPFWVVKHRNTCILPPIRS